MNKDAVFAVGMLGAFAAGMFLMLFLFIATDSLKDKKEDEKLPSCEYQVLYHGSKKYFSIKDAPCVPDIAPPAWHL